MAPGHSSQARSEPWPRAEEEEGYEFDASRADTLDDMNILELQVRVVVSGIPETVWAPVYQDVGAPAIDPAAVRPDVSALADRSEPDQSWPLGLA
jgi:hypothetical protein